MKQVIPVIFLVLLSACAVGKKYVAPDMQAFDGESLKVESVDRFEATEPVAAWWRTLADPVLTDLVEEALVHNHDVRIAVANLQEVRALLANVRYDRFPTVETSGAATAEGASNDTPFGPLPDRENENYRAGLDVFWELDLFGRVSQRINDATAVVQSREADLNGAYVSVAAETALAYIQLRGAQYSLDVADRNAANQSRTLDLIRELEDAGRGDRLDVLRAKTQLELTQSTIPILHADIDAAIHRLGVLTGQTPDALHEQLSAPQDLPSVPPSIAIGNLMDMLKRRPDIHRAERLLASATAQYNLAVAELYPSVTLGGSFGFSATALDNLGSSGTSTYSFGPSIRWAALNLGRVKAGIRASDARTQASLAVFEQTVLRALEETQTAVSNFSRREINRANLLEAASASAEAAELARLRFDAGVDDFLDVLDAERTMLQAQERLAQSETLVLSDLIGIYKALGGGWETQAGGSP